MIASKSRVPRKISYFEIDHFEMHRYRSGRAFKVTHFCFDQFRQSINPRSDRLRSDQFCEVTHFLK